MRPITTDRKLAIMTLLKRGRMPHVQIAQRFNVPVRAVDHIALSMWEDSEIAFLRQNYQTRGPLGCSRVLGYAPEDVSAKARQLGLSHLRVIEGGHEQG